MINYSDTLERQNKRRKEEEEICNKIKLYCGWSFIGLCCIYLLIIIILTPFMIQVDSYSRYYDYSWSGSFNYQEDIIL